MPIRVEFLGHAATLVELDGLTDPDRPGDPRPDRAAPAGLSGPTARFPGPRRRRRHLAHALGPPRPAVAESTAANDADPRAGRRRVRGCTAHGFPAAREARVGEAERFGDVEILPVPAVHSGFRPPSGPTAEALGYVIRGSRSVYFAGDTAMFDAMADLTGDLDLALIPVWGWGPTLGRGLHMDPETAAVVAAAAPAARRDADPLGNVLAARDGPGPAGAARGAAGRLRRVRQRGRCHNVRIIVAEVGETMNGHVEHLPDWPPMSWAPRRPVRATDRPGRPVPVARPGRVAARAPPGAAPAEHRPDLVRRHRDRPGDRRTRRAAVRRRPGRRRWPTGSSDQVTTSSATSRTPRPR